MTVIPKNDTANAYNGDGVILWRNITDANGAITPTLLGSAKTLQILVTKPSGSTDILNATPVTGTTWIYANYTWTEIGEHKIQAYYKGLDNISHHGQITTRAVY